MWLVQIWVQFESNWTQCRGRFLESQYPGYSRDLLDCYLKISWTQFFEVICVRRKIEQMWGTAITDYTNFFEEMGCDSLDHGVIGVLKLKVFVNMKQGHCPRLCRPIKQWRSPVIPITTSTSATPSVSVVPMPESDSCGPNGTNGPFRRNVGLKRNVSSKQNIDCNWSGS